MDEIDLWIQDILASKRRALAQAITLIESQNPADSPKAQALLARLPRPKKLAKRIGISGPPGVGKSTLIETLGVWLIAQGHRVAVLAIDPTSPLAGGSILGDKTRMHGLATAPDAYVRPSAARGLLGGIGIATPEAIELCEAAGFDVILVESVGVGQSEFHTALATDCLMLLCQPNSGDELQAIKRGILELSDLVVVNKADAALVNEAENTRHMLSQAFGEIRPHQKTKVLKTSALNNEGVEALWQAVLDFLGSFDEPSLLARRQQRFVQLWHQTVPQFLWQLLESDPAHSQQLKAAVQSVSQGDCAPLTAARALYQKLFTESKMGEKSKRL